jgi:hypothetical protein
MGGKKRLEVGGSRRSQNIGQEECVTGLIDAGFKDIAGVAELCVWQRRY